MELQLEAAKLINQREFSKAINLCQQSIEVDSNVTSNYWYLGLAFLLEGQETEAQVAWLSAIAHGDSAQFQEKTAELIQVLSTAAIQHEANFDLQTAWVIRQYIYEFSPENFNNLLSIILLSIKLDSFQPHGSAAVLQATKSLLIEEVAEVDLNLLAEVLKNLLDIQPFGDFIEVCLIRRKLLSKLSPALDLKNKLARAYSNLGQLLYKQGNYTQAYNTFLQVLEVQQDFSQPEIAGVNFNIGIALISQGEFEKAISFFQRALELEPTLIQAEYQLIKANYETKNLSKGYQFTQDWFSRNIRIWEQNLSELAGISDLSILEIGSWEGRSTCWLLENILTHDSASITCIDTFEGSVEHQHYNESYLKYIEERFDFNIAKTGTPEKVTKLVGKSEDVMRSLPLNSYDLIYVDGSHLASDVLRDAVLAWDLVKVGGLILFDDYDFIFSQHPSHNTKVGIDAFINAFSSKISIIHQSHQVFLKKMVS